jgi:hypothetical protein
MNGFRGLARKRSKISCVVRCWREASFPNSNPRPLGAWGERALAERLLRDHYAASAALIALMLKNLSDEVRTHTLDAVRNGTGKVELRTRVSNEIELVLEAAGGNDMLWLARARGSEVTG